MLQKLLDAPRVTKRVVSVVYDAFAITLALWIAWVLRLGNLDITPTLVDFVSLAITIVVSILIFIRLGLYRAILRYMAADAVLTVIVGLLISALTLAASSFFLKGSIPRSVPVIYLLTSVFLIGLPRLMVKNIVQLLFPMGDTKVIIYGAGSAGRMLADSLRQSKEFQPVAFLDDDLRLNNSRIRGLPVYTSNKAELLVEQHKCSKIFLALGAVNRATRLRIVRRLERLSVQIQTIPTLEELTSGSANISELRDLQIEDLLGRDPVQPDRELMRKDIFNQVVMITGAGGSIGSELCRQILEQKPRSLILFELNEFNLYTIESELRDIINARNLGSELIPLLGSTQDIERVRVILREFKVSTVYHAAAYKHVGLVENNVVEGIRNNVFGTLNCARAASDAKIGTFVLVSTDKAVRSTNIMGASKRLAELVIKCVSQLDNNSTRFSIVRFGNVLGSSGSVVPRFNAQIDAGGPVTVTHPDVTRYFMTIPEAAQLVIQAGALAKSGETYVLDMGDPVKIDDLAHEMILLSGLTLRDENNPQGDIAIEYTGLRPGEKLYEELLITENVIGTKHPRITEAIEPKADSLEILNSINNLRSACDAYDYEKIQSVLKSVPSAFCGNNTIHDSVFVKRNQLQNRELSLVKS